MEGQSEQPLLTIVVLVYNTSEYLSECFNSLLLQSYKNIEIIAVDDDSTDDSLSICRDYERRHHNFRCITKENEGGAVAGNLGVSLAQGKYVAIVDSDDVITLNGYALLIKEAIEHDADIAIGRAERLLDGRIVPVASAAEQAVWRVRREITSARQFPEMIYDGFYWNKIFKTSFLRLHALGMVPGLLYADRPFVHQAYFYSQKTVIIPDLVYLWRRRSEGASLSISQNKAGIDNFRDRILSMSIEWEDFSAVDGAQWYRELIAIHNLDRTLFPIAEITSSPEFRDAFFAGVQSLQTLYGGVATCSLGVVKQLYLALIKGGYVAELCYFLGKGAVGNVREIDGSLYWALPYFESEAVSIDRDVYRVKVPGRQSIKILAIDLSVESLSVEFTLHDSIAASCSPQFVLQSRERDQQFIFPSMSQLSKNRYSSSISLSDIKTMLVDDSVFDLYVEYEVEGGAGHIRVLGSMLTNGLSARLPVSLGSGDRLYLTKQLKAVALEFCL